MKIIVFFLCTIGLVVSDKLMEDENMKECLKENGLKEEDLEKMKKEVEPKLQCFMACYFEKYGIIKDGEINKELLKKSALEAITDKIKADKLQALIDTCMEEAPDTLELCLRAHQVALCLREGFQKNGFAA